MVWRKYTGLGFLGIGISYKLVLVAGFAAGQDLLAAYLGDIYGFGLWTVLMVLGMLLLVWFVYEKPKKKRKKK